MILTHPVLYRNIMQNTLGRFLINSTDSPREVYVRLTITKKYRQSQSIYIYSYQPSTGANKSGRFYIRSEEEKNQNYDVKKYWSNCI